MRIGDGTTGEFDIKRHNLDNNPTSVIIVLGTDTKLIMLNITLHYHYTINKLGSVCVL